MITDNRKIWKRFEDIFETVDDFYRYAPTFCNYHKRLLEELCEDNIIYAEIRASLSPVCFQAYIIFLFIINLFVFFFSYMVITIKLTLPWKWQMNWKKLWRVLKKNIRISLV